MRTSSWIHRCAAVLCVVWFAAEAGAADASKPSGKPPHAAPAASAKSPDAALRERVTAYWKARVARDKAVYAFYPPPEKRLEGGILSEGGAVRFDAFQITGVDVDGDSALVTLEIDSHVEGRTAFPVPAFIGHRTLRERWDLFDGVWYKQTTVPAMRAAAKDLQRAVERRRAAEAADAQAQAGSNAPNPGTGPGPGANAAP